MQNRFWRAAVLGASILAATGGDRARAADEIVIGEIHPITGPASYYGAPESRAIQLAAEQINQAGGVTVGGKPFQLRIVTQDDQASPTAGVAALRKLVSADVRFLIGPLPSGVAPALKPIIERNDKLTQLIDGTIADGLTNGRNIFRNQATVDGYNVAVVQLFQSRRFKSVAVMTDQFHAGFVGSQPRLMTDIKATGAAVAAEEAYKLNDTDFSAQLTKLRGLDPEVILIRGYPAEGALITKQARQLGLKGQVVWEMVAPPATVLQNIPATEMQGVFDCIPPTTDDYVKLGDEAARRFDAAYRVKYGTAPGELSALSSDAVFILKAAFEAAGSTENAAVDQALRGLKVAAVPELITRYAPVGPDGLLFDSNGQTDLKGVINVWRGDGWEPAKLGS